MKKRRDSPRPVKPARDNPIIAAVRRSVPVGGAFTFDVDRPSEPALDRAVAFVFGEATIREVGVFVLKALLTGDRQIVRTLKDALKECNHIFRRDREPVLREQAIKILPELMGSGLDITGIKREIEKRYGKKLEQHQWNRLRVALCLVELPTGRPKKVRHRIAKSVS